MSVYTELTHHDIIALLAKYDLGQYQSHQGISAGVENTNYFVNTTEHALVLTLFEKHDPAELPFFLQLGEHLYKDNCKVPRPFRSRSGDLLQEVKQKPAVLIERIKGGHVNATTEYAQEIAIAMAGIHLSTQSFPLTRVHSHNVEWVKTTAQQIMSEFSVEHKQLLKAALEQISSIPQNLPSGVIHADLFHDNALFDNGHITGIIDWYFAGIDSFALDIAITMNDWCLTIDRQFDPIQGELFLQAYQRVRPLTAIEKDAIRLLQIQAATRFWLSRWLAQKEHKNSTDTITVKNPDEMKKLLEALLNYTH